jgi:CBS domain-containing protein
VLATPVASDSRAHPLNSFVEDDRAASAAKTEVTRVRDLMSTDLTSVSPNTSVQEIADILVQKRISSVPVIDTAGRLVGIVSEDDLIRRAEIGTEPLRSWWRRLLTDVMAVAHEYVRSHGRRASDVMRKDPVTTTEDAPLSKVAAQMAREDVKQMPVVHSGRVVGMLSRSDIVRKLASASTMSATSERLADDAIRERIIARISSLPWAMRVRAANATVKNGIATIYGWVGSDLERRALHVVTENTPGVVAVRDRLKPPSTYI